MTDNIPDEWWLNATPFEPETYVPPTYSPSDSANRNHELFSEWRNNEYDDEGGQWSEHLLTGVGIILAIGLFLALCSIILYCCCLGKPTCLSRTKKQGKSRYFTHTFFWLMWLMSLIGLIFMLLGMKRYTAEFKEVGKDAGSIADYLLEIQDLANSATKSANDLIAVSNTGTDEVETCINDVSPFPVVIDNSDSTASLNKYVTEFHDTAFDVDITDAIVKAGDLSTGIEDSQEGRNSGIILFAVFNVVSLIGLAILEFNTMFRGKMLGRTRGIGCCARVFILSITTIMFIIGWLALAIVAFIAMAGGDFCQSPDEYVLQRVDANDVIKYYMTCTGSSDLIAAVETGQELLNEAMAETVMSFSGATIQIVCGDTATIQQNLITDSGYQTNLVLIDAQQTLQCEGINSLYVDAVHKTFCTDMNLSVRYMMLGFLLQSLGFLLCMLAWKTIAYKLDQSTIGATHLATPGTTPALIKNPPPSAPIAS